MEVEAPSSFNQGIFFEANSVFYGTDDGFQDGSFAEFRLFESFYESVEPKRLENIHFVGAVGGLYCLNLLPLFQPTQITFFDINHHATAYLEIILKVFSLSSDKEDFLRRLSEQDYEVESDADKLIRENLALKQQGLLTRDRGSSYKRSLEVSWKYALDHFDVTKKLLAEVPVQIRTEGIESQSFGDFARNEKNVWMFCSNIVEFTYGKLRFDHPGNAVMISLVYPGQVELLDLAPFDDNPTEVYFEIPLKASVVNSDLTADEGPPIAGSNQNAEQLAKILKDELELAPKSRLLDVGSDWGQLAIALDDHLDQGGEYEGFDPQREHLFWAKENVMPLHPSCAFHVANIRNRIYNPGGSLDPTTFRFPYEDGHFDVVVASSLFPYMLEAEFEHYMAEISRVLKPGGRLCASFFLVDEESAQSLRSHREPYCFRYPCGELITAGPNGGGLAAYQRDYVKRITGANNIDTELHSRGKWRQAIDTGFEEDIVIGRKKES